MFYDPMIAKLCTWAPTREAAVTHMHDALDQFILKGAGDNLTFLSSIVDHPRFKAGELTTAFIAEEYPDGFLGVEPDTELTAGFISVCAALSHINRSGERTQNETPSVVRIGRTNHPISSVVVDAGDQSDFVVTIHPSETFAKETEVSLSTVAEGFVLQHAGCKQQTRLLSAHKASLAERMIEKVPTDTSSLLLCPMPGLLVAIHVGVGDTVEEGQALAVVEAMKMENVLTAPRSGTIASIPTSAGMSLSVDDIILEFEQ